MSLTLYASNLPLSATEATLVGTFGKFGRVRSVRLDPCGRAGRNAFVEMDTADGARRAIAALHSSSIDGRLISVNAALCTVPK